VVLGKIALGPTIALIAPLGIAPYDLLEVSWVSRQSKLIHQAMWSGK
jgi:hypothetical protein